MLKKVIRPDKEIVSFTYDALGRRLSKTFKEKTTRWIWDGNIPVHEWAEQNKQTHLGIDNTGLLKEELPENLITWIFQAESFAPVAKLFKQETYSIVADHLGTPAEMYNSIGEKVWEINLNIYGETRNIIGLKTDCPFRYPGQYEDEETGLYYNRFRYYDAEDGFYTSQDPIGLRGGVKLKAYVKDTQVWIDPKGYAARHIPRTINDTDAIGDWDRHLGSGPITNIHPRTGLVDNDRIFAQQPDGSWHAVRMGDHEMRNPNNLHYHLEEFDRNGQFIPPDEQVHVNRTKPKKKNGC
jgi:RHS repeat-associated protein